MKKENNTRVMRIRVITAVAGISFCLTGTIAQAQHSEAPPEKIMPSETTPYRYVDKMPKFPGGDDSLMKFVQRNVQYPIAAKENRIQGKVVTRFVIDEGGNVINVEVLKGVDKILDAEAIRVVLKMPRWTPGELNGKKVPVYYTLPVNFRLAN